MQVVAFFLRNELLLVKSSQTTSQVMSRSRLVVFLLIAFVPFVVSFSLTTLRSYPSLLEARKKISSNTGKQDAKKPSRFLTFLNSITSGAVESGPRVIHHALYWLTATDAVQSVIRNQYTDFLGTMTTRPSRRNVVPSVYSKLFYFARLRPRLVYSVGALLRALQLCTPLGRILDPSIGVGAGINLCAIMASSQWVKPLILGWTTTKYTWKWLGAKRVERAYLPISLSIHEWEEQKKPRKTKKQGS